MGYAAAQLDTVERRRAQEKTRPSFGVFDGAGLDSRARAGVSARFVARLKAVVVVACVLVTLGACRVALCSSTVTLLEQNASTRTDIKTAQTLEDDLKVQRSVLSSNSRIVRIATQNYGMVKSTDDETLDVSPDDSAESQDASDQSSSDGETTQDATEGVEASTEA